MKNLIRTLIANGFHLNTVRSIAEGKVILNVHKFDSFETKIHYSLLYALIIPPKPIVNSFLQNAKRNQCNPIAIGPLNDSRFKCISLKKFFKEIGGEVNSALVLNPNIENILDTLGKNRLPPSIKGNPADLLEEHVTQCLQYLLNHPARRYGRDRSFESLPDGIALGQNGLVVQFDTKAYFRGFSFQLDDIKRFTTYINEFNQKYESHLGKMYSFLVITSVFKQSKKTLEAKSNNLYERSQTKLCCLEAKELGRMVKYVVGNNNLKNSINWKQIFSELKPTSRTLSQQIKKLRKDNVL